LFGNKKRKKKLIWKRKKKEVMEIKRVFGVWEKKKKLEV